MNRWVMCTATCLIAALVVAGGVGATTLVSPPTPMALGSFLVPPSGGANAYAVESVEYNIYTGGLGGYTFQAATNQSYSATSGGIILNLTFESQVWQDNATNELLFLYRVSNDAGSNTAIQSVTIALFDDLVNITDSGVWDQGRSTGLAFQHGDPTKLNRGPATLNQFSFDYKPDDNNPAPALSVGEVGSWVYVGTDYPYYTYGLATVQDGTSQANIQVLVPTTIPEPITMAGMLMAVGGLAGYIRRRRMA